jgi:hypothetical protein
MPAAYSYDLREPVDRLWDRIGELMGAFSTRECQNFLTHQGYVST